MHTRGFNSLITVRKIQGVVVVPVDSSSHKESPPIQKVIEILQRPGVSPEPPSNPPTVAALTSGVASKAPLMSAFYALRFKVGLSQVAALCAGCERPLGAFLR